MDLASSGGDVIVTEPSTGSTARGWTPRVLVSFLSMVLVLEMLTCSYMMVSVALPEISAHFHTTQGVWILTAFLLVGAVSSPLIGKLADMHGKRKLMMWCIGLAAVGALISVVAPAFPILVVGWSLTGLLSPCLFLVYALIRDVYPPRTIAMAVSLSTTGMGLVAIPAPFLAGWILDNFGFRGIFWFFAVGLPLLALLIRVTTEESPVRLRSRIDLIGAVLLGAGLGGLLLAVSFAPDWGWAAPSTLAVFAGGAVFMVAWFVSARMRSEPVIDLAILTQRPVALTSLSSGLGWAAIAAFTMLLPILVMTPDDLGLGYGFGADASGYAWFKVPQAVTSLMGGFVVGALVPHVRPKQLMLAGLGIIAGGLLILAVAHDSRMLVVVLGALIGFGGGMTYAATPNLLIEAVPQQQLATAGAIASTAGNLLPAILPVFAYAVLNSHIAMVVEGATLYSDAGITISLVLIAVATLIGAAAAILIPRTVRLPDESQTVASDRT